MSWLYACTIYPLQLFFKYVYLFCVKVTGSYGLGLIGLSLCAAIAFVPLGRMAKKSKWKEDHLQDVMRPQIEKIKAEYTGAERQEAIARLYKRYSYHPLMTLRSAIGILLQFPFLTAAYKMVQELTVLKGQSFWFIKDLSVPDGLWGGVNALPIVMTLINFASIATAPHMRGKDRIQAVVIALLFLWLLYGAPSALLIYWTCNNINYLVQNFVFHDKKNVSNGHKFSFRFLSEQEHTLGENGRTVLGVVFFVLLTLTTSLFVFEVKEVFDAFVKIAENNKAYIDVAVRRFYRCALLVCLFPTLFFFKRLLEQKFTALEVLLKTLLSGIALAALELYIHRYLAPIGVPNINGGKFTLLLWGIVAYCLLSSVIGIPYNPLKQNLSQMFEENELKVFINSVLAAVLLTFVFCESELYYSDPSFFTDSLAKLLLGLAPYGLAVFAVAVAVWFIVPRGLKLLFAVVALFASALLVLNTFVFTGNYGSLDVTLLSAPQALYSKQNWYKDTGALLIAGLFVGAVLRFRLAKVASQILGFVCLSFVLFSGYTVYETRSNILVAPKQTQNLLPDFHDRLWGFSKEGKNVIIFFWDMFTGGHMQEILAKRPELKKELLGFVWYPDTVAVGSNTFISSPSLYGGSAFSPQVLNQDEATSNFEKLHRSYAILPNAFLTKDFDVVVAGAPYENLKDYQAQLINNQALLLPYGQWEKAYIEYWRKMHDRTNRVKSDEMSRYLLTISLFKCAPSTMRASCYDNGNWHGLAQDVAAVTAVGRIKDLAPLQYMSSFSNVNASKSTFKFICSGLSHFPWHLPEDSLIPVPDPYPATKGQFKLVDGIIPEHIFTENHMISFLVNFCKWLRNEGIYDNTRIIVVSDHDESDSKMLNEALGGYNRGITEYESNKRYPGRVHALMMYKDFNCNEELKVSSALVSTEDTPAMALKSIIKSDNVPDGDRLEALQSNPRRVRYHASGPWRPSDHAKNKFLISEYRVTGSIFRNENWEQVKSNSQNDKLIENIDKDELMVTDKMECLIHLFWGDETLYADGWAFIKGEDTKETTVHLLVTRPDGSEFVYEARKVIGNDLVKWFKDPKYKYGRYEIALPKQLLGTGKHEVRCIVNKKYLSKEKTRILIQ